MRSALLLFYLLASPFVLAAEKSVPGGRCSDSLKEAELRQVSLPIKRRQIVGFKFDSSAPSVKVAFFDADDTLRRSKSGAIVVNEEADLQILPGRAAKIAELNQQGYLVVIVSNQGGIPQYLSLEQAESLLAKTISELSREGGRVHYFDFAEFRDQDRKPGIGMAERLEQLLKTFEGGPYLIDRSKSFMVGDAGYKAAVGGEPAELRPDGTSGTDFSNSDRIFAEKFGIPYTHANDYFKSGG